MDSVIQVTLRISGTRKMLLLQKTCSIRELFQKVRGVIGDKDGDFYLICEGEQLEEINGGTIESIGITHQSVIDFCQRQRGGSVRLQPLPGKITLTREPCCITYDDDPYVDRARMPCQCVLSVEAIREQTQEELNKGRFKIKCPNCHSDWPLFVVRHALAAIMSSSELETVGTRVNDNYLKNSFTVQQCPMCSNYCEHTDLSENRVLCRFCTRQRGVTYQFCVACSKPWQNPLSHLCGNAGCSGKDQRSRYLKECQTKIIGKVSGVPSVRKCEKCTQLVYHIEACKHMTCKCGHNFCFVCLKPQIDGKWQCGYPDTVCEVAPRQS